MLTFSNIFITLLISTLLAIFIVPRTLVRRFHNQERFGVVEKNGQRITRANFLGGVSFFPVILITTGLVMLFDLRMYDGAYQQSFVVQIIQMFQLLTGMAALYIIGLKDDIYGTSLGSRIATLFVVSLLFPVSGIWMNNFYGLFGVYEVPYWFGMSFTVLLVMYLTMTISLIDGIDGMGSGQCTISLFMVLLCSIWAYSYTSGIVACAGLGITVTFFFMRLFGRDKESAFMGNSGSLPLGYLICFAILNIYKNKEWHGSEDGLVLAAFCTMLMPAWDLLRIIKSRIVDGRDIMRPDRNMLNHKLIRMGVKKRWIPSIVLVINLLFVVSSGILLNYKVNITYILLVDVAIYLLAQWTMNFMIQRYESRNASLVWERSYGKDNWSDEEIEAQINEVSLQVAAQSILLDKETPKLRMLSPQSDKKDIPFIPDGMNSFERNTKRFLDFIAASGCLIVFSPLFLLSYILIKLDDGGPAIFRQERIGRFGRPFYIYKFRSMRLDAEAMGPQLSHAGGDDDCRLTKAGKFLRAHHLDELPQLWNVFCGDMAFIGYRPERQFFIDQIAEYDPRYFMLYQIRPGVTSYATLYNGYTDTMEKMLTRLELDLYYLKHRSWWFDAKILFLTFWHIVGGKKF